jgi:hypothetical protein
MSATDGLVASSRFSPLVYAHVFLQPYTLPVPFWMYLYACAATLVVSFGVVGAFVGRPAPNANYRSWDILPGHGPWQAVWTWWVRLLRIAAFGALVLTIIAGLAGTDNPAANIGMTLFWVVFLLAFTYVTAVCGNLYDLASPWRSLVRWIEACGVDLSTPRVSYPAALGYIPAFAFYVGLISIELFTLPQPRLIAIALLVYSAITLLGAFLFGKRVWFEYGELFDVFFRLIAMIAPVEYHDAAQGQPARVRVRAPLIAALHHPGWHPTIALFVLFMLSSTTYDAIHETFLWVSVYWQDIAPLFQPLWGADLVEAQVPLTRWYIVYQRAGLVLSPFVYLLFYVAVLSAAAALTRTRTTLATMAVQFAPSLVPIALVYHATHYYTVMTSELRKLGPLAADPLGLGWQLFALPAPKPTILDMGVIWHTQVVLMLAGHVAAVYLAHVTAVRLFPSQRLGVVSQVPMLILMVVYTCVGLWVLSLPLATPQVVPIG